MFFVLYPPLISILKARLHSRTALRGSQGIWTRCDPCQESRKSIATQYWTAVSPHLSALRNAYSTTHKYTMTIYSTSYACICVWVCIFCFFFFSLFFGERRLKLTASKFRCQPVPRVRVFRLFALCLRLRRHPFLSLWCGIGENAT